MSAPLVSPEGVFAGYASLFGRIDMGRDCVARGAFAKSLRRRGAAGVRLLWQHEAREPIGVWTRIAEDARGLYVEGRLNLDVARGREAAALLRQGALDGLSIGFRSDEARVDPRSGVRRLGEIDLWEISLVTFPMLPEARVAPARKHAPPRAWRLAAGRLERAMSGAVRALERR